MTLCRSTFLRAGIVNAVILVFLIIGLEVRPSKAGGSQGQPLSLNQLKTLIQLQTPDSAVAGEIQRRGLNFVPSKEILESLQSLGAGPQTLEAVDDLRPMLDEARRVIPGTLKSIYQALDQGNPQSVRPALSNELATNARKLDAICKPFTYRAHYVEAIVEHPGRQFEVRVRVLFKPVEEQAYILLFRVSQDHFSLQDIADPPQEWFGPQLSTASDLARRFMYASMAGRKDVLTELISASVDVSQFTNGPCWLAILGHEAKILDTKMISYKGLKAEVIVSGAQTQSFLFLVDSFGDQYKVVAPFWKINDTYIMNYPDPEHKCGESTQTFLGSIGDTEDPNLEAYTLKRFGLKTP